MSFIAGSRLRSTVTFVPETGTVLLANVTARAIDAEGNETDLTVEAGEDANQFTATFLVPDTAISGPWTVRWEADPPKISVEASTSIEASGLFNP